MTRSNVEPDRGLERRNVIAGRRSLAARDINGKYVAACYGWQMSMDEITWVDLPDTAVARLDVTGMLVDRKTFFRKRYTTSKGGTTAWSNSIGITVV